MTDSFCYCSPCWDRMKGARSKSLGLEVPKAEPDTNRVTRASDLCSDRLSALLNHSKPGTRCSQGDAPVIMLLAQWGSLWEIRKRSFR